MPKVMPAKVRDARSIERASPGLGIHLLDRLTLKAERVREMLRELEVNSAIEGSHTEQARARVAE